MKNLFITGATGFIGSFIVRKFLENGYKIRALTRKNGHFGLLSDISDKIEWLIGDVLDIPSLEMAIKEGDIVVHAAAIVSFDKNEQEKMLQVNIEGTKNIVNVCLEIPVKKLVFISSVASLGRTKNQQIINENAKWDNEGEDSVYARSKYLAEMEVWRGIAEGLFAVMLNPSVVLGVGDWDVSSSQIFKYIYQKKPFYTKGKVNFVDVRDVADASFLLAENEILEQRFICNAGNIHYKALFEKIAERFSVKAPSIFLSGFLSEIFWRLAWIGTIFSKKTPLITKETARMAQQSYFYENDKIKKILSFNFRTLDDTLAWACEEIKGKQLK